jgi:hypothetical protein
VAIAREPGLVAVGLGGIVLSLVCLVGVVVNGRAVAPEGDLLDAATFDFGVGVFTLTIALLLPLAGYTPAARQRWRRAFYIFVVYGLVLETAQAFRGLDPRFSEVGDDVDAILGLVFGVTAGLNTILVVLLALRFFRADVLAHRRELRNGVRYGMTAVALSFGVGVVMSINRGRHIGEEGNLIFTHALSVHGLQAIPLVALLASAGNLARRTTWIHVSSASWLAACTAALLQALLGRAPFSTPILTVVVVAGLAVWAVAVARSAVAWTLTASWRVA